MDNENKSELRVSENPYPPEWHCDIYCRKIRHMDCEGKQHIKTDAIDLCPYFDEMLYKITKKEVHYDMIPLK